MANEEEKVLFDYAQAIVAKESRMQHLKYQLFIVNNKLDKLK